MNSRTRTYTAYSIGVAVVWAVILVLARRFASAGKRRTIFLVFGGFAIGWTSATIARYVYPPPGGTSTRPRSRRAGGRAAG